MLGMDRRPLGLCAILLEVKSKRSRLFASLFFPLFFGAEKPAAPRLAAPGRAYEVVIGAQTITTSYGRNPAAAVGVPKQLRELLG
jgi:hypothetical protein